MIDVSFTDAYTQLRAAWPQQSFSIDVSVWYHDHSHDRHESGRREVEYSIWEDEQKTHHRGPTLAIALALALAIEEQSSLAEVDAQTEGLALIQGGHA